MNFKDAIGENQHCLCDPCTELYLFSFKKFEIVFVALKFSSGI